MAADSSALDSERLHSLLHAGRGLLSELRPEQLLDQLLDTARVLTGAHYAAIGVLDEDTHGARRFLTRGIDADTHRAIGDLPRGRGVLGVLIDDPRPLRLRTSPRTRSRTASPPATRRWRSFLGVPIVIRGEVWGNLYLTEKAGGGEFDAADEESVVVLADWAAIAIENARLYESLDTRRAELERAVRGLEATSAVAQALGTETDLDRVLELIVKRARALVEARGVLVLLADGEELVIAAAAGQVSARSSGFRSPTAAAATCSRRGQRCASRRRRRTCGWTARSSGSPTHRPRCSSRSSTAAGRSACCARSTASTRQPDVRRRGRGRAAGVRRERGDRGRDRADGRGGPPARGAGLGRGRAPPVGARAARRDAAGARRAEGAARRSGTGTGPRA